MSRALHCRPSEVYGMDDAFVAYSFDSAVTRWGMAFEAALQDASEGAKTPQAMESARQRVVRRWIPSERRYADPSQR
jgi:hypothetical protein